MEIFIKYQSKRSPASPILNMKIYFSFFILKPLWFLAHRRPLYLHHQRKLIKRALSIPIFINLFNNPLFSFLIKIMPKRKNLIYLIRRNGASFIIIKHSERNLKFITDENYLIHGGNHKLRVVYLISLVNVYFFDKGISSSSLNLAP